MSQRIFSNYSWLAIPLLILMLTSCGDDKSATAPVIPDTVIADNVHVLGAGTAVPLDSIGAGPLGPVYCFSYTGPAPDIKVGDIVVGTDSGGFLRTVTAVAKTDSTLSLGTDDASLTDAIIKGSLQTTIPLTTNRFAAPAAASIPIPSDTIDLSGVVIYSTIVGTITITDGFIYFKPDLDIGFNIEDQSLSAFHAVADGELSAHMDVHVDLDSSLLIDSYGKVASLPLVSQTVYVGAVPVVIETVLEFYVGTIVDTYSENLDVNTGFATTVTAEFGSRYDVGVWSSVWNQTSLPAMHETTAGLDKKFSIRASLFPQLVVTLSSMQGPWLRLEPYLIYSSTSDPLCRSWEQESGVRCMTLCPMQYLDSEMSGHSDFESWDTLLAGDTVCVEDVIVPLSVGNYWIFDDVVKLGISDSETVSYAGQNYIVYHWNWYNSDGTPGDSYYLVRNDTDGFWLMGSTGWDPMLQPSLTLRYPAAVGETWDYWDNGTHTFQCVSTNQTITAPAGTFTCYVYQELETSAAPAGFMPSGRLGPFVSGRRQSTTTGADAISYYLYFAPGVGYVGSGDTPDGTGPATSLLTEFYVQ